MTIPRRPALQMKTWAFFLLAVGLTVSFQTGFGAGSAPTDPVSVTPTWRAQLLGERVGFDGTRWFYAPFADTTDDPPVRYLTLTDERVDTHPIDNGRRETITTTTTITRADKKTGLLTQSTPTTETITLTVPIDDSTLEYYLGAEELSALRNYWAYLIPNIISDVEMVGPGTDPNDKSAHIYTLSDLYTFEDFVSDVVGWVPGFQYMYTADVNWAYIHLPEDELTFSLYNLHYKWNAGNQGVGTVVWDEQFTPENGDDVQHHVMSWTGSGESPDFTIYPANVYNQNGTYHIVVLPVEVTDTAYIVRSSAWIKRHTSGTEAKPEMPKLEVRILGAPAELQVEWKLENRYPRRQGRDDLNLPKVGQPGVFVAGDQPWKIWEEVNNSNGPKFFGGDVKLKYKVYSGTSVAATGEVSFKILGENPDDARCKAHIIANQGALWYAWAVARHESQDSTGFYNQFANGRANGGAGDHGAEGEPFYSPIEGDGWGLFQRDSSGSYVTTEETWSWEENMRGFFTEYSKHRQIANNYVDAVLASHRDTFEEPEFVIEGRTISGRDVLALTSYNGLRGTPQLRMRFDGSKPAGQRWSKNLPNARKKNAPYVNFVMKAYNNG